MVCLSHNSWESSNILENWQNYCIVHGVFKFSMSFWYSLKLRIKTLMGSLVVSFLFPIKKQENAYFLKKIQFHLFSWVKFYHLLKVIIYFAMFVLKPLIFITKFSCHKSQVTYHMTRDERMADRFLVEFFFRGNFFKLLKVYNKLAYSIKNTSEGLLHSTHYQVRVSKSKRFSLQQ